LRVARGFKAGGVNIGTTITENRREFDDESLYEIGLLHEYTNPFQKTFSISNNLFIQLRQDVQVKTSYQDDPRDPSSFTFYTDNATTGKSLGLESKLDWHAPKTSYHLGLHSQIMHSEYGSYIYEGRNLKGRAFAYAPTTKIRLSQSIELIKNLTFSVTHNGQSSLYLGNSHNELAPSFIHTDAFLTYKGKSMETQLFVRNLFNDRSETRGFFFGNRPPNFNQERFIQIGAPRIIGIRFSGTFNLI
jgi:iron complex outermembrane receptor protein